jgi:uncharacterized MAPEG superfamily protein
MLVASVVWTWFLIMSAAGPTFFANPMWSLGARDVENEGPPGWAARLRRASENMKENLPLFATLVLVVHVAGEADELSALGTQLFFSARVLHALIYVAGIPHIRTVIWGVSVVGMGLVGLALL